MDMNIEALEFTGDVHVLKKMKLQESTSRLRTESGENHKLPKIKNYDASSHILRNIKELKTLEF